MKPEFTPNPCPITFHNGVEPVDAERASTKLANFLNTVSKRTSLSCTGFISTDSVLHARLQGETFPNRGKVFYPVVCMVASAGGSGKDTFIEMASKHLSLACKCGSISTVDVIKKACSLIYRELYDSYQTMFDVTGQRFAPVKTDTAITKIKSDAYRQMLHDVKDAWTKFNDGPVLYCMSKLFAMIKYNTEIVGDRNMTPFGVLFVNNRDIDTYLTMKRWCHDLGIMCIGIKVNGKAQASDYENTCDSNVDNIPYDVVVENNGTLADLDEKCRTFADILLYGQSLYGFTIDKKNSFMNPGVFRTMVTPPDPDPVPTECDENNTSNP